MELTLKAEQEEYIQEKIKWEQVSMNDVEEEKKHAFFIYNFSLYFFSSVIVDISFFDFRLFVFSIIVDISFVLVTHFLLCSRRSNTSTTSNVWS